METVLTAEGSMRRSRGAGEQGGGNKGRREQGGRRSLRQLQRSRYHTPAKRGDAGPAPGQGHRGAILINNHRVVMVSGHEGVVWKQDESRE
jgi:hypothetical protein